MVVIQYDDCLNDIYGDCIAQVRSKIPDGNIYKLIKYSDLKSRANDYRGVSNVVRFTEACFCPNMLWLDSDCLVNQWPDFELKDKKVYFAQDIFGQPDNYAFFVNGRCDFFKKLMDEHNASDDRSIGWWKRIILKPEYLSQIEFIPHNYFVHVQMSRFLNGRGYLQYGSKYYSVNRDAKTNELTLEIRI